jgi:hypothetical protein
MTQALPLPPLEVLQKKFDYNPETGTLTRNSTSKTVGHPTERGWLRVKVNNTDYRVHRIVWKMYYGEDPPVGLEIDHINRNKVDNRISNLRVVTCKENAANSARVLFKKPPKPKKTSEELKEIRSMAGKRTAKAIILISPSGEEKWYPSVTEAARTEQINQGNISSVLKGRLKTIQGFTARYAEL